MRHLALFLLLAGLSFGNDYFFATGPFDYDDWADDDLVAAFLATDGTEDAKVHASLAANWTPTDCTVSNVTDAVGSEYSQINGETVKIQSDASVGVFYCNLNISPAQDWSDSFVRLHYFVDDPDDKITKLVAYVRTNSTNHVRLWNTPDSHGRHMIEFTCSGLEPTGTFNGASISTIRFEVLRTNDTSQPSIHFDALYVIKNYPKPRLMLWFDNVLDEQYSEAFRIMQKYPQTRGKGSYAVNTGFIGTDEINYMTLAQLNELEAAGNAMTNHSYAHERMYDMEKDSTYMRAMYWQMAKEMQAAKQWMVANGFAAGSSIFVLPSGSDLFRHGGQPNESGNWMTLDERRDWHMRFLNHCDIIRYTDIVGDGGSNPSVESFDGVIAHRSGSYNYMVLPNSTNACYKVMYATGGGAILGNLQWCKDRLDKAVVDNGLVSFYFHNFLDTPVDLSPEDFEALILYAIEEGFEFVNAFDLVPNVETTTIRTYGLAYRRR